MILEKVNRLVTPPHGKCCLLTLSTSDQDTIQFPDFIVVNHIDPMQKWLLVTYSFVRIQDSLTNLVLENKI